MMEGGIIRSVRGKQIAVSEGYLEASMEDPRVKMETCPLCSNKGKRILQVTVSNHVDPEDWRLIMDGFRFCYNTNCNMMYYNNATETYFLKSEVKPDSVQRRMKTQNPYAIAFLYWRKTYVTRF